jgi:type I restriction enzyme, S subunit
MNSERLLAHYKRIADAPNAIARLRRFILDLAVRGKLVLQDPSDEPASELLKRTEGLKSRAREAGGGKHSALKCPATLNKPRSSAVPPGWEWTTLGAVSKVVMGQSPPGDTYNTTGKGVPLINGPVEFSPGPFGITVVNQYTTAPTNYCEKGELLICVRGSTTGRSNIAGFRACIGRGVAAIQPSFEAAFIHLFVWNARDAIIGMGRGIAFPSVSRGQIEELALPLPPLAEQRRIVAKVDELMALCDRLDSARAYREVMRDRLTAASLARLIAPNPDPRSFAKDAQFALKNLIQLTSRRDQIRHARRVICSLGFRGYLTSRLPDDGLGTSLVLKLKDTPYARGGGSKASTKAKNYANIPCEPIFVVPEQWGWARLQDLTELVGDIDHKMPHAVSVGVPFLSAKDLTDDGELDFSNPKFISEEDFVRLSRKIVPRIGDIVYSRIGARLGKARLVKVDTRFLISYSCCLIRPRNQFIHNRFLQMFLDSHLALSQAHFGVQSIGVPDLGLGEIKAYRIPVPPLPEQHRIVAKIDELMALCDRLEASLTTGEGTRLRLLDALLAEALAPADAAMPDQSQPVAAHG